MSLSSRLEMEWRDVARWWIESGSTDPVYAETINPLLDRLLDGVHDAGIILDLGCGEGSVAESLDRTGVVGVDITRDLLRRAREKIPVVCARLPHLDWVRPGSVRGAYAVFVVEHLADLDSFFDAAATAVTAGGFLIMISNHPAYTAPGSGPLVDTSDGEVLWRWGPYFSLGLSTEPAGERFVTFHHRPLGTLLSAAGTAGWSLEEFVEAPLGQAAIDREPTYIGQGHMPRLFGARWVQNAF